MTWGADGSGVDVGSRVAAKQCETPPADGLAESTTSTTKVEKDGEIVMMLRNIPCSFDKDRFVQVLQDAGLEGTYSSIELPMIIREGKGKKSSNRGYAFVTFENIWYAKLCQMKFEGRNLGSDLSSKRVHVEQAHRTQLEAGGPKASSEAPKGPKGVPTVEPPPGLRSLGGGKAWAQASGAGAPYGLAAADGLRLSAVRPPPGLAAARPPPGLHLPRGGQARAPPPHALYGLDATDGLGLSIPLTRPASGPHLPGVGGAAWAKPSDAGALHGGLRPAHVLAAGAVEVAGGMAEEGLYGTQDVVATLRNIPGCYRQVDMQRLLDSNALAGTYKSIDLSLFEPNTVHVTFTSLPAAHTCYLKFQDVQLLGSSSVEQCVHIDWCDKAAAPGRDGGFCFQ